MGTLSGMRSSATAALLLAAFALVGCSTKDDAGATPVVGAAFYPLAEIVHAVGGDAVEVVTVVPPGEEAHEYEPTPSQIGDLQDVSVIFYLAGFQPAVDDALAEIDAAKVDLMQSLTVRHIGEDVDPHVWLDPQMMIAMTEQVREVLAERLPEHAADIRQQAEAYISQLETLNEEMRGGLSSCSSRLLVTTHEAFGYLADAYGLQQVGISGISPGDEPSAKALEQIADLVREQGVSTVFSEEGLPDDLARTVADETGATTATLFTIESPARDELDAGANYESFMRDNLAALRAALECA